MANPWIHLPQNPPYVLPSDAPQVDAFNHRHRENDQRLLRLDVRAEPYIGALDAPIVLLNLNPGYVPEDRLMNDDPDGKALWQSNVLHESLEYPFYVLDPRISWAPVAAWWRETLNALIAISDTQTVARNVLCIEYFPYHSRQDPGFPGLLPSQRYGFTLVDQAIDRGAVILVTRAARVWMEQVPRLIGYGRAFKSANPRRVIISPGYYPEGFPLLSQLLRR